MGKSDLTTPVLSAKINTLYNAKEQLQARGVACRHTSPRRSAGILRVAPARAEEARRILAEWLGSADDIISAAEAHRFFCPACNGVLSLGSPYCPQCRTFLGDRHSH